MLLLTQTSDQFLVSIFIYKVLSFLWFALLSAYASLTPVSPACIYIQLRAIGDIEAPYLNCVADGCVCGKQHSRSFKSELIVLQLWNNESLLSSPILKPKMAKWSLVSPHCQQYFHQEAKKLRLTFTELKEIRVELQVQLLTSCRNQSRGSRMPIAASHISDAQGIISLSERTRSANIDGYQYK